MRYRVTYEPCFDEYLIQRRWFDFWPFKWKTIERIDDSVTAGIRIIQLTCKH